MPASRRQLIVTAVSLVVLLLCAFVLWGRNHPKLPTTKVAPAPLSVAVVEQQGNPVHEMIGHSVEGRTIDAYTYGTGTTKLLFVGGMHGGYEWNGVLLAYTYMDYLSAHLSEIPAKLSIIVIPDINPDGVFKVIGKEGRFTTADVPASRDESPGRFNANKVDLNRNFGCNWAATSAWKGNIVSGGTSAFSEPESRSLRDFVLKLRPVGVVFWHSQAGAVYASECEHGVLPVTIDIMNAYARAAGYPAVKSFSAYKVTGDSEGWLASVGIPALTVELSTHDSVQWDKNLAGIKALVNYYNKLMQ